MANPLPGEQVALGGRKGILDLPFGYDWHLRSSREDTLSHRVSYFVCWVIYFSIFVLPLLHRPYAVCSCFAYLGLLRVNGQTYFWMPVVHFFYPNTAATIAVSNIKRHSGCNPLQSIIELCDCRLGCTIACLFMVLFWKHARSRHGADQHSNY